MTPLETRTRILLAAQSALLGAISPNIRAILCSWSIQSIQLRVIFDGTISDANYESMGEVETELMADFPNHNVSVQCNQLDPPYPVNWNEEEVFVYARRETDEAYR